jgi:glutamate--cysteine ligase
MSNPGEADDTPITSVRQLAEYLAAGCKPREAWRIGTEHEKFGVRRSDLSLPPYEPDGIRAVLHGIAGPGWAGEGWSAIRDGGNPIGLKGEDGHAGASVSLEPGGQLELSGAPLRDLHETKAELDAHLDAVDRAAGPLGLGFAPLGFHPLATREEVPWMPKSRYAIMRRYMPEVGTMGLDMMLRTCTVQVNLDYGSEADMARKLRVALALQPLATALFASSPFKEGRPSGFLSTRAQVWTDVDAARSGMPVLMFEDGFGFERFVAWALDVPMFFVLRDGRYVDLAGRSFRDLMAGRMPDEAGPATLGDFADHVTTIFTDVRVKRFLEMRGADAGSPAMMLALGAFWVGLLYDDAALAAADALVRRQPWAAYAALRPVVPARGLDAPLGAGTLRDLAREAVVIARDGLRGRGRGEEGFLDPLAEIAAGAPTQAERALSAYDGPWRGNAGEALRASVAPSNRHG